MRFPQLGRQLVGGTPGDRLGVGRDLLADCIADRRWRLAVLTENDCPRLLADLLITLTVDRVKHGLSADDLAGWRDERRIAQVLSYFRDLVQHGAQFVDGALLAEL